MHVKVKEAGLKRLHPVCHCMPFGKDRTVGTGKRPVNAPGLRGEGDE